MGKTQTYGADQGPRTCEWCEAVATWEDASGKHGQACASHLDDLRQCVALDAQSHGNSFGGEVADGSVRPIDDEP